ncbi:MAG: ROK family protein [Acidobacteriia bacterium]|nr:ROK family protein [Terriglobia bacterium]
MPGPMTIGVDVGGTKVAAGLVDSKGEIVRKVRVPMVATADAETGFSAVRNAVTELVGDAMPREVRGIGICSPGPLDPRTGVVLNPPNVPCWRDFPLGAETERAFRVPTRIDNDANAAGLAETLWGAGVGYSNVFYATLGTGIGTGIVFDNKIYWGRTGSAAEGGHNTIDYNGPRCGCGKRGCIEILCSGPAIARRARARIVESHLPTKMLEMAGGMADRVKAEHVGEAFNAGDALAREVLEETADLLAIWLGNVVDMLEPEIMIVGGGVAQLMSSFFGRMKKTIPEWSINPRAHEIPLVLAKYTADAGIAGAAALCR